MVLAFFAVPFDLNSAVASELLNTKSFLKDVVAASPGMELIMPLIVVSHIDGDEHEDKFTTKFNVYPAGTDTKLFATPERRFIPPATPCAVPTFPETDWHVEFFGENNTHTGLGLTFEAECVENGGEYKAAFGAYVYVADTTQAGSSWAKSWNRDLISVDFVDWDDDQQDEVKVVLAIDTEVNTMLRVIILDKLTGAIESSKKYKAVQISN